MTDPLDRMPEFFSEIQTRMLAGRRAYGDRSFSKDPRELLEEVQQELLDVCGWSYVLYCRVAQMRDALRKSETSNPVAKGEPVPSPATRVDDHGPESRWVRPRPVSEPPGRLVGAERTGELGVADEVDAFVAANWLASEVRSLALQLGQSYPGS